MRTLLAAVLLTMVAVSPVRADVEQDKRVCKNTSSPPQTRIAACTRLVRTWQTFPKIQAAIYYNGRGIAHVRLKQYRQAIRDFDQAIRLDPRHPRSYFNLGLTYHRLKQYRQAIAAYSRAISVNPRHPRVYVAYNNRGAAYYKLGNRYQAYRDWRKALRLNPSNPDLFRYLRRLGLSANAIQKPPPKAGPAEQSIVINANTAGHFYVKPTLNGASVRLLVDTGATSTVLSQTDARKVGIDPSGLDYKIPVSTANGVIRLAQVNINKLQIGAAVFWNVRVLISPRDKGSVIGVSTLRRFRSYTVEGDKLTLRW